MRQQPNFAGSVWPRSRGTRGLGGRSPAQVRVVGPDRLEGAVSEMATELVGRWPRPRRDWPSTRAAGSPTTWWPEAGFSSTGL